MVHYSLCIYFIFIITNSYASISAFNIITFIKDWSVQGSSNYPLPKEFLDVSQLITEEGYGVEIHHVTSEDGYILQLTRVMPRNAVVHKRLPVLLAHGILASSEGWVWRGKSYDIGFILVEKDFDVWLCDFRGNPYSKRHKHILPQDPRFWDYSFHEMGKYDLPAFVDFILKKTGASQIGYVGHSMGTSAFFVFASLHPEYNKKIFACVCLAPIAAKFPFDEIDVSLRRFVLNNYQMIYEYLRSGGLYEFLPRTSRLITNAWKYCSSQPMQDYCMDVAGLMCGEHRENFDRKTFGKQMAYLPAGTSIQSVYHLAQIFTHGFQMPDYGKTKNLLKYNSTKPPEYPIHLISSPIALFYGENDPWTSNQGIQFLRSTMPNVKLVKKVPDHKFTHADFIIGINTNDTLYGDVINFLDFHSGK